MPVHTAVLRLQLTPATLKSVESFVRSTAGAGDSMARFNMFWSVTSFTAEISKIQMLGCVKSNWRFLLDLCSLISIQIRSLSLNLLHRLGS